MPGAIRFLYGLVLGVSVGIIVSKLIAASGSGSHRQTRRVATVRIKKDSPEAEEVPTH